MKFTLHNTLFIMAITLFYSCNEQVAEKEKKEVADEFVWQTEQFADIKIIRYQIPGFEKLSLQQKKLVYYLTEAGYSGRDIMWDQNYRHNLKIRKAFETIVRNYKGDKSSADWNNFMVYMKRIWFSNGIHHHYASDKFTPGISREYLEGLLNSVNAELDAAVLDILYDQAADKKKVCLEEGKLLSGSSVNFYQPGITESEVDAYYLKLKKGNEAEPVEYGLNTRVEKDEKGKLKEVTWKLGGMYSAAIEKIIYWLEKAVGVAENPAQAEALKLLIEYYKTGDLKIWDAYNIAWTKATEGDIDYINGFIEVYNDPKGYKGSYESIVQIKDFEASETMKVLSDNVQWFEQNSPIMSEHKKKDVVGVTYKVINVAGESGDASPSTPVGVNLPNSNWIRAKHGSKSVSLGNITFAYDKAAGTGLLKEFSMTDAEFERSDKHGDLAGKLHTALHEVIGHASGQLNPGVGTPKETLKNYASALEEGRADLVALYYIIDPKLVELGLVESAEVGKAEYDSYVRNGMMVQLRRLEKGQNVEEAHMRNRQMIVKWCYEKGQAEKVIEKITKDGKTYFVVNDYDKLRGLFGQLLKEVQRIKSEGDYEAGMALVEKYGVKVDPALHAEVIERAEKLNIAPYGGFINPRLVPVTDASGEITDVKVEYPDDFTAQMLEYSGKYANLQP